MCCQTSHFHSKHVFRTNGKDYKQHLPILVVKSQMLGCQSKLTKNLQIKKSTNLLTQKLKEKKSTNLLTSAVHDASQDETIALRASFT